MNKKTRTIESQRVLWRPVGNVDPDDPEQLCRSNEHGLSCTTDHAGGYPTCIGLSAQEHLVRLVVCLLDIRVPKLLQEIIQSPGRMIRDLHTDQHLADVCDGVRRTRYHTGGIG